LYVHEFNVPNKPGFWGLTKNQIATLNSAPVRWCAVLLLRSADAGYVLTAREVCDRIKNGLFELSRDGDYKVNQTTDLKAAEWFENIPQLLDCLLSTAQ